jgi:hypothetical protein
LTLRVSNQEGDPVTEQELTRRAKRRLAIIRHAEEVTGNVALTCRYREQRSRTVSEAVLLRWATMTRVTTLKSRRIARAGC